MFGAIVLMAALVAGVGAAGSQPQFRVIKEWKYANYTWRTEEQLRDALAGGMYNPEQCIMAGIGYRGGFYYVTTPRMYRGTPATLSRIPERGSTMPPLTPFPSWERNRVGDCDALQNVQNVQIDADGMLYAIDSGRIGTLEPRSNNLCPAKIVKFDLNTPGPNELATMVFKYEFPASVASSEVNYLYDLVLDDGYVYISDNSAQDPGLIVFDEKNMSSWKIRHGTFKADANVNALNVSGTALTAQLNIAGLALGPPEDGAQGRLLYYSPLSSNHLFAVGTNELRDPRSVTLRDVQLVGRKSSQTDGMTMDANGTLYFGLLGSSSVARWDTRSPFGAHPIARDRTYIQWPNAFTFNADGELVVLASTLAKFITRRVDLAENNFRLLAGNVSAQSYVQNRFKYHEHANGVHYHSVSESTPSSVDAGDNDIHLNDLLIYDDIQPRSGASSPREYFTSKIIPFIAMLLLVAIWQ